jgi:ribosome-associated translation inhibitor RaiA
MAYVTSAEDLVTEFQRRRIDARLGRGSTCLADVNNVEVQVSFSEVDVSWQGNDGGTHRASRDIDAGALADEVIDSLVNPA